MMNDEQREKAIAALNYPEAPKLVTDQPPAFYLDPVTDNTLIGN